MLIDVSFECGGTVIATARMAMLPDKGEIINYAGPEPKTFCVRYREFTMEDGKAFSARLMLVRLPESSESGSTKSSSTEKGDTDAGQI